MIQVKYRVLYKTSRCPNTYKEGYIYTHIPSLSILHSKARRKYLLLQRFFQTFRYNSRLPRTENVIHPRWKSLFDRKSERIKERSSKKARCRTWTGKKEVYNFMCGVWAKGTFPIETLVGDTVTQLVRWWCTLHGT